MKALPLSKLSAILLPGQRVIVVTSEGLQTVQTIRSTKKMPKDLVLSFMGIDTPEATIPFRNATISIERDLAPPLPSGEYFISDLLGMTVRTTDGRIIGIVEEVLSTGSNDVYIVRGGGREYLIPAIKDVIREIDPEGKAMLISPMKGLLD
ncbi:MAG: 16S rRNA processing protein RimM [Thermodesulfovibrio sp.]|nr:16S rRNA processing protein RimM [Thermodesulfovibrio sp.]